MSGYGYYWAGVFLAVGVGARRVRSARPDWPRWLAILVGAVPPAYCLNLMFEGPCTALGWWTYTEAPSPMIQFGDGKFSLVTPIAFLTLFPVVVAALLDRRTDDGRFAYEARLGICGSGPRMEAALIAAIVALVNGVYFLTGILPGVVLRYVIGPDSTLVP